MTDSKTDTIKLTKDNFLVWTKVFVCDRLCIEYNIHDSGTRLVAHIRGEEYIDISKLDFMDTWCSANIKPESYLLRRDRRTKKRSSAQTPGAGVPATPVQPDDVEEKEDPLILLAPQKERDARRESMIFRRDLGGRRSKTAADYSSSEDEEEATFERVTEDMTYMMKFCIERQVDKRELTALRERYDKYCENATLEEKKIFAEMVKVIPDGMRDTLKALTPEKWTSILRAQNPFKLYDHMKEKLAKALSDKVMDTERKLNDTKQYTGESLAGFLTRIQDIFDQLDAYGAERTDAQKSYILVHNTNVAIFREVYKRYCNKKHELPSFEDLKQEYEDEEKAIATLDDKLAAQQTIGAVDQQHRLLASIAPAAKIMFQTGGGFQLAPPSPVRKDSTATGGRVCWECEQPGHSRHECPIWLDKQTHGKKTSGDKKPAATSQKQVSGPTLPKCVVCGSNDHRYDYVCPLYEETQKKLGLAVIKPQQKKNKFFRRVSAAPEPDGYDLCMNQSSIAHHFGSSSSGKGSTAGRR